MNTTSQATLKTSRACDPKRLPGDSALIRGVSKFSNRRLLLRLSQFFWLGVFWIATTAVWPSMAQQALPITNDLRVAKPMVLPISESIWEHGLGEGFRSSVQSISVGVGGTVGMGIFGSHQAHDLALVSLTYGHMLGRALAQDHWYRGNFELRLELFTGAQFSPTSEWLVGLTPHLRYNFATGTRWVPFIDGGAGVTATSIGHPDLGGTFEFNLQLGVGVQWFLKDNLAVTVEARYVHWSCAGISKPNLGLNGVTGMLGLSLFF